MKKLILVCLLTVLGAVLGLTVEGIAAQPDCNCYCGSVQYVLRRTGPHKGKFQKYRVCVNEVACNESSGTINTLSGPVTVPYLCRWKKVFKHDATAANDNDESYAADVLEDLVTPE